MHAGIADPPPGADTPLGADPPCTVHAGRYGQQASSAHPTGMHTCFEMHSVREEPLWSDKEFSTHYK